MEFFSFQYSPKNLDPSYKMYLDLWDCLEREGKTCTIAKFAKFHRTDLVILVILESRKPCFIAE